MSVSYTHLHDAVRHSENIIDILYTLQVLNLGNDFDMLAVLLLQYLPDLKNIVRRSRKGSRNVIEALFNGKRCV